MTRTEIKRAVIYTRQSKDTEGNGQAVARQLADCERLAAARGWHVVARIEDNDTSASNGKTRRGFNRVMGMVDGRTVDVVIVWAVDRLVRKLADLEHVIDTCEAAGVKLATVSGDLDLSTDQGRLVGRILHRSHVARWSARAPGRSPRTSRRPGQARHRTAAARSAPPRLRPTRSGGPPRRCWAAPRSAL